MKLIKVTWTDNTHDQFVVKSARRTIFGNWRLKFASGDQTHISTANIFTILIREAQR